LFKVREHIFKKVIKLDSSTIFEQEEIKIKAIIQFKKRIQIEFITVNFTISKVNLLLMGKKIKKTDKYSKIKQEITAMVKESRGYYG